MVLCQRRRHIGNIALHRVCDCVHSRSRSHRGRRTLCKFRVCNHLVRCDFVVNNHILADSFCIRQRHHVGDLTGSPCRGRNRYQRKNRGFYQSNAAVPSNRPFICHQNIHCLSQVNTASASHSHKYIDVFPARYFSRLFHHLVGGIGNHALKNRDLYLRFLHFV